LFTIGRNTHALLAIAAWQGRGEPAALGMSAVGLSGAIALAGVVWWAAGGLARRRAQANALIERH